MVIFPRAYGGFFCIAGLKKTQFRCMLYRNNIFFAFNLTNQMEQGAKQWAKKCKPLTAIMPHRTLLTRSAK